MKLNISQKRLKRLIKEEVEKFVATLNSNKADQSTVATDEINEQDLQDIIRKEIAKTFRKK